MPSFADRVVEKRAAVIKRVRALQDDLPTLRGEDLAFAREEMRWLRQVAECSDDRYWRSIMTTDVREIWSCRGVGTARKYGFREAPGWRVEKGNGP